MNWLVENATDFVVVHFHTFRYLRNGYTVLQRATNRRAGTW